MARIQDSEGLPRKKARKLAESQEGNDRPPTRLIDLMECVDLFQLLELLHDQGWAVTIGRTRDGGAIAWAFLMGGKPIKRYTASRAEVVALLDEVLTQ